MLALVVALLVVDPVVALVVTPVVAPVTVAVDDPELEVLPVRPAPPGGM